ncbi:MAG TPA: hypothetical protein VKA92_04440 [Segetibacter sp.]|nr:hypothetical protein [Segetibacter sp.]
MNNSIFFNRHISWLSFNERVRQEAGKSVGPSRVYQIPIHLQRFADEAVYFKVRIKSGDLNHGLLG